MKYKRILLKLSGEALQGSSKSTNIDPAVLEQYCSEILTIKEKGVEIAIVIGGGNIFRGGQAEARAGRAANPTKRVGNFHQC